jgi:hypothetical protein
MREAAATSRWRRDPMARLGWGWKHLRPARCCDTRLAIYAVTTTFTCGIYHDPCGSEPDRSECEITGTGGGRRGPRHIDSRDAATCRLTPPTFAEEHIECRFECPRDPLLLARGSFDGPISSTGTCRVLDLSSEMVGRAWRIRTADPLPARYGRRPFPRIELFLSQIWQRPPPAVTVRGLS